MNRVHEEFKFDVALPGQPLASGNVTSEYYPMKDALRAVAVLESGALDAGETTTLELLQATDAAGTGAKGIPSTAGQEATATITANRKIAAGTVDTTAAVNGDTLTITSYRDGYDAVSRTYTKAAATDADAGEFADAVGLAFCINHFTNGVPGLFASALAAVVTITANPAGEAVFSMEETGGHLTLATVEAVAFVEIENMDLDGANGFGYIAAKVTTTGAATTIGVKLIRQMRDGVDPADVYAAWGIVVNA